MNKLSAKDDSESKVPAGWWGTTLSMTPVVLTVLATIFAGLSSSEMTQSMFHRAVAAQEQSKAGDEWAFFQTKRIRGTGVETSAQLLESIAHPQSFTAEFFNAGIDEIISTLASSKDPRAISSVGVMRKNKQRFADILNSPEDRKALSTLCSERPPESAIETLSRRDTKESIDSLVQAIAQRKSEAETAEQVKQLTTSDIHEATSIAERNADAFDKACAPVSSVSEKLRAMLSEMTMSLKPLRSKFAKTSASTEQSFERANAICDELQNSFKLTTMNFDAKRYRQESTFNRKIAEMFEAQVRRSGVESDRHRERSRNFFYSMLAAQAGVTISSLALSKERRHLLWTIAALAGFFALTFSGYVYFSL